MTSSTTVHNMSIVKKLRQSLSLEQQDKLGLPKKAGTYISDLFCQENVSAAYGFQLVYEEDKLAYHKVCHAKVDPHDILDKFISDLTRLKGKELQLEDKQAVQRAFAYCLDSINVLDDPKATEKKRMFFCFNILALYPAMIDNFTDLTFILKHVSQRNRAWVKACVVQALKNRVKAAQEALDANEEHIAFNELCDDIESVVIDLQQSVAEVKRRDLKASIFEQSFAKQLDALTSLLAQLEHIRAQLGIRQDNALTQSLKDLYSQLQSYLIKVKNEASYTQLQDMFKEQFLNARKELNKHKKSGWHNLVLDAAYVSSEMANIGLVLQEVVGGLSRSDYWINLGVAVGRYSNPFIYGFKVMQRGMKLIGRKYLGWEFDEDEVGVNPNQNRWDFISMLVFSAVTTLLILGAALGLPLLDAIAWGVAPIGLGLVWKSEYGYQNDRAQDRLDNMRQSDGLFDKQAQKACEKAAWHKKIASYALAGVILFIALGMLASSLAGIPGLNIIFEIISVKDVIMISGAMLAGLAVTRAVNFLHERGAWKSLQALGGWLKASCVSLYYWTKNLGAQFVEGSGYKKAAMIFSAASFAVTISVLSGGIAPLVGLIIAGICQTLSISLRLYEAYKNKIADESEAAEAPKPLQSEEACEQALDGVLVRHGLKATVVEGLDARLSPIERQVNAGSRRLFAASSPAPQTSDSLLAENSGDVSYDMV